MRKCVVVLGMHRSGTSAFMGILNLLGVALGSNLMKPAEENPKGYFENYHISQLNERLLKSLDSFWDDVFLLPEKWWDKHELHFYKGEAIEIINKELGHEEIYGIKDPRLSILLPFWENIFRELDIKPYYVICIRNPLEVAESLKRRSGFSLEKSALLWMKYMLDAEFYSRGFPRVFVSFDELLRDPEQTINNISDVLNIKFLKDYHDVKDSIDQFLEKGLKHHTLDVNSNLMQLILDYYYSLLNLTHKKEISDDDLSTINNIREQFLKFHRFFYHVDVIEGENAINAKLKAINLELEATLNQIYSSRGWKALLSYYKLREKILPQKSKRMFLTSIILKTISGPARVFRGINKRNLNKFFYYLKTDPSVLVEKIERKLSESFGSDSANYRGIKFDKDIQVEQLEDIVFQHIINPQVSIVIPVWNKWRYTYHCLKSLSDNTTDVSYEVIIIDNASTDETGKMLDTIRNVKVLRNEENLGFIRACNMGIKEALGDYILFLNNDTQVKRNWLKSMLDLAKGNNAIGAVGAKLIYPDGKLQEAGGIVWNDENNLAWNYGRYGKPNYYEYNYVKEVDYCSAACLLVRKDLLDKIGGFDSQYAPAYCEDTDLAFTIRELGHKVVYQPKAEIVHFEGTSAGTDVSQGIKKYQVINQSKFYKKWHAILQEGHSESGKDVFLARDRSQKKKIMLFVDHYVPTWDKDAGSVRMYEYIKIFLDMGFKIILWPDDLRKTEPYTSELQQMGVEVVYGSSNFKHYVRKYGKYIDYAYLSRPDIAINYIDAIKKYTKARILYDCHDLHFLREQRRAEIENKPRLMKEVKKWREKEFYLMENSDVTVVLSSAEKEILNRENQKINAVILPYVQHVSYTANNFEKRKDLIFIGGFAHMPNEDAVLWFVNDILPLIKKQISNVRFIIIGSHPTKKISGLDSDDVIVKGFVEDVSPFFHNARIFVSPLRYGAGLKGKIIHAMSYGLPVVTTSIGAEGTGLKDGKDVLIADDSVEFARKTVELYKNEKLWEQLSEHSINYVRMNNTSDVARQLFEEIFSELELNRRS